MTFMGKLCGLCFQNSKHLREERGEPSKSSGQENRESGVGIEERTCRQVSGGSQDLRKDTQKCLKRFSSYPELCTKDFCFSVMA